MLNIANVIEEGRWGGPQKRICLISESLKSHSIKTTVILPKLESEKFQNQLTKHQVNFILLPIHRLGRNTGTLFFYILTLIPEIFILYRTLKKGNFDLVHVSGGAWQIKGPIASYFAGLPIIWHLNDSSMPNILVYLFRKLGRIATAFFVSAQRTFDYYLKYPEFSSYPYFYVPAPVDTGVCNPEKTKVNPDLLKYKFPRIMTVCNINPVKGLDVLISAAGYLKNQLDEFTILIIGGVPDSQASYFQEIKTLIEKFGIEKNVIFAGASDNVPEALKAADIYVCSSRAESSPMAVWEAMAMGVPIVSTDVGDVSLYIDNGKNGIIVPVDDSEGLAKGIIKLAEDNKLRSDFGMLALTSARKELDVNVIAKITASAYKKVLQITLSQS
jgi:glycosyltransferase involved in cell wall biosynthesis